MSEQSQKWGAGVAKSSDPDPKVEARNLGSAFSSVYLGARIDEWKGTGDEGASSAPESVMKSDAELLRVLRSKAVEFFKEHPELGLDVLESAVATLIPETLVTAFCIVDEEDCEVCPQCGGEAKDTDVEVGGSGTPSDPYRVSDPGLPSKKCVECGYAWGSVYRMVELHGSKD